MSKLVIAEFINQLRYMKDNFAIGFEAFIGFVSVLDFTKSCTRNVIEYGYSCPEIDNKPEQDSYLEAKDLRHPLVEKIQQDIEYVPNDISLGQNDNGILLYGVNSSGKSCMMKSIGLSIIMAQCGMYVPASSFKYNPYHCLFTRISNNDNIFKGQSSFVVEMTELKGILIRANNKSLVLGDELCSGTESISGVAIVTAGIQTLAKRNTSFIFATHLHQLAELSEVTELDNVEMYHLEVIYNKEQDTLLYNRKLTIGSGSPIYGLEVCKALNLDDEFMRNAHKIRKKLTNQSLDISKSVYNAKKVLSKCEVCGNKAEETHHIKEQKDADENKMINHIHKNRKSNLVGLCKKCHHDVTHNDLIIDGYEQTSNGIQLKYYRNKTIKKTRGKKKFDDTQVKLINDLYSDSKANNRTFIVFLKEEHNIDISTSTLNKITRGKY